MMVGDVSQLAALPVPVLAVVIGVCLYLFRSRVRGFMEENSREYRRKLRTESATDSAAAGCIFSTGIFLMSVMFVTSGLIFTVLVTIQAFG
jgi:hypothetical protein